MDASSLICAFSPPFSIALAVPLTFPGGASSFCRPGASQVSQAIFGTNYGGRCPAEMRNRAGPQVAKTALSSQFQTHSRRIAPRHPLRKKKKRERATHLKKRPIALSVRRITPYSIRGSVSCVVCAFLNGPNHVPSLPLLSCNPRSLS